MRSFQFVAGETGYAQLFTNLRHDARGGGNLLAHQQLGALAMGTNASNTNTLTLTINGTAIVITFVSVIGTTPGNVLIGSSAAATLANLIALLNQPQTTTATGVALSTANQQFVSYLTWPLSGTTITPCSNNTSLYAPLSSFTAAITVSSASWTARTMQLYVEPGVVYVGGTRIIFTGGSTPTVTAPASNPRIDVLTIDNTGTLAWTTGAENSSPSAPTYPANKVALCELYNVVSETALYDLENETSGQGYIYHDVRPTIGSSVNLAAVQQDILPDGDGTRNLGGASFEWNNIYAKSSVFVNGLATAVGRYGGTGADGALSVSSGTTSISAGNAALLVKNYSSISITGTGKVQFTNPNTNGTITLLLVSGSTITLTSSSTPMLDASAMGGAGGSAVVSSTGNNGSSGYGYFLPSNPGQNTGAAGAAISAISLLNSTYSQYLARYFGLFVAAGGAAGNALNAGASGGTGGNGGGCLIIEAVGAWNFTTSGGISVAGASAGNASGTGGQSAGGGGGGAGGFFLAVVGSISANTGTITISGGSGGTNIGSPGSSNCGGGGGSNTAGTASSSSGGGAGATGVSQVVVNSVFV